MTPDQLSTQIDGIVSRFESAFGKQVSKTQTALFEQMQLLLNRLDLNPDGTIKQSQENRRILAQVDQYFSKAFNQSGYYYSLDESTKTIASITLSNSKYFASFVADFSSNTQYVKNLQNQTIAQIESLLANEGLEAMLKQPILQILNQNINTGASFTDLLAQIREFTLGSDELQGQLQRYSRQIVTDTLFNYNRSLQEAISQKVGLQWYAYSGGMDKDSRDFCKSKVGKYFKKEEIEKWASQDWQGKRRGTTSSTIYIFCGGYNCRHQMIAVSESVVPDSFK